MRDDYINELDEELEEVLIKEFGNRYEDVIWLEFNGISVKQFCDWFIRWDEDKKEYYGEI